MHWKGPFKVTSKKGAVNYEVDLGATKKIFHINLLKRYEARDSTATACAVISIPEEEEEQFSLFQHEQKVNADDVAISNELPRDHREALHGLVHEYREIFSDVPGQTDVVKCNLRLATQEPIHVKQYPLSYACDKAVEDELQTMLTFGVIEPSESP